MDRFRRSVPKAADRRAKLERGPKTPGDIAEGFKMPLAVGWSTGMNVGVALVIMALSGTGSITHRLTMEWVQGLTVFLLMEVAERPVKTYMWSTKAYLEGRAGSVMKEIVRTALWSGIILWAQGAAVLLLPRHYYGPLSIAWVILAFGYGTVCLWAGATWRKLAAKFDRVEGTQSV